MNNLNIPGVIFRPLYFKPYYGQFAGEICQGVQIHIKEVSTFKPYSTGLHMMQAHMKLYPEKDLFEKEDRIKMFDKVMGTDRIRKALIQNIPVKEIEDSWQKNLDEFKQIREKYLIYKL